MQELEKIKLLILTPTLNCKETLSDTLDSVKQLSQFPLIQVDHRIGDSGSVDGTKRLIHGYCEQNAWARSFDLAGLNIPATLNAMLDQAVFDYMIVLNGDDYFIVENMMEVLGRLLRRVDYAGKIISGHVKVIDQNNGAVLGSRSCSPDDLLSYMSVNHPATIVPANVMYFVGRYSEDCPFSYDYEWFRRAAVNGVSFVSVDSSIACVRLGGLSNSRMIDAQREILSFKIRQGSLLLPYIGYAKFLIKRRISMSLPEFVRKRVVRFYRRVTNSIDGYM